jgi:predicted nucleic acid-binding protein
MCVNCAKAETMLVDTDVLIWYMRGNRHALKVIEDLNRFSISVITYMELVQGMRNKSELGEFRKALRQWKATILFINEEISAKAMFFVERHFLGHAMQIADAHIAATAMVNAYPILTANDKHYRVIKEIDLKIFRP